MSQSGRCLVVSLLIAEAMRRPKLTVAVVATSSDSNDVIG